MLGKVNLSEAFSSFEDHWNPRVVSELNGQQVKIAKVLGEFDWHHHEHEDELFMIHAGVLEMQWRESGEEKSVELNPGEMFLVPRGIEHRPVAAEEVEIILFEPASTLNTGNVETERTRRDLERL